MSTTSPQLHMFHAGLNCPACSGEHNKCVLEGQDGPFERGQPHQGTALFEDERRPGLSLGLILRAGRDLREKERSKHGGIHDKGQLNIVI